MILIDMEMPGTCLHCGFSNKGCTVCIFTGKTYNWGLTTRPSDCPLVEVVRCRDCQYYDADNLMCKDIYGFGRKWKPADHCSYGRAHT